jgi:hypothetical protein
MKITHKLFYLFLIAWGFTLLYNGVIISESFLVDPPGCDLEGAVGDIFRYIENILH